ncbi:MAG: hypothetical protein ISR83_00430 [Candidatus Marinimicrobia bacterium]|nr:hypothetical protein [Candidatus Neomarinimicrobiota bacterium]
MSLNERIQSVILSNLTDPENRRIGVEIECFFYDANLKRIPVNKTDRFSAMDFIEEINELATGESPRSIYSLEPGGQLEWASSPYTNLHLIHRQMLAHFNRVKKIVQKHNLVHMDFALEPLYAPDEIDLIKQNKYQLMDQRFRQVGNHGPWMMRNTTSVQVNLDISSKEEAETMAWLSDVLEPFCALLFANSPFMNGQPTGNKNKRYDIWNDTDNARCGNLVDHDITSPNGLLEKFSSVVLNTPAIFIYKNDGSAEGYNGSLGKYLKEMDTKKSINNEHIMAALHQVFTHVRFKNVLEVRGADRPPRGFEMAPAAFWMGLLSEPTIQEKLVEIFLPFTLEDRKQLNQAAKTLDLNQPGPQSKTMGEWIRIICELAQKGLDIRSKSLKIENERVFLDPYLELFYSSGFMSIQTQNLFKESKSDLKTFLLGKNG